MLVIRAGSHKMLVGIANREDPDKNAEACLIWVCTVCLDLLGWQLEFNISRKKNLCWLLFDVCKL